MRCPNCHTKIHLYPSRDSTGNGSVSTKKQSRGKKWRKEHHKAKMNKHTWMKEEDIKLLKAVKEYGPRNWTNIARDVRSRTGKQCRERWLNHLNPGVDKSSWTLKEERTIYEAHKKFGNRWTLISRMMPGRTDNAIKNHWNSSLRKRINKGSFLRDLENPENSHISSISTSYSTASITSANTLANIPFITSHSTSSNTSSSSLSSSADAGLMEPLLSVEDLVRKPCASTYLKESFEDSPSKLLNIREGRDLRAIIGSTSNLTDTYSKLDRSSNGTNLDLSPHTPSPLKMPRILDGFDEPKEMRALLMDVTEAAAVVPNLLRDEDPLWCERMDMTVKREFSQDIQGTLDQDRTHPSRSYRRWNESGRNIENSDSLEGLSEDDLWETVWEVLCHSPTYKRLGQDEPLQVL